MLLSRLGLSGEIATNVTPVEIEKGFEPAIGLLHPLEAVQLQLVPGTLLNRR